jgi:phage head maturation protease
MKNKNIGVRSLGAVGIRAVEGEGNERKFILSFSSEEPYERWFGPEILDHSDGAVDLTRLNEIGVLLFNHDTDQVVGKILRAWIEDRRGNAEVEFDTDEDAEKIRLKVASGTLKGVSVRYTVSSFEDISANKTSTDGFIGPCSIARKWTPLEVSIVSVPADPTVGVGREFDLDGNPAKTEAPHSRSVYERQLAINKNYL